MKISSLKFSFVKRFIIGGLFIFGSMLIASCFVSLKPVYYEDDKKLAHKTVEIFHTLYKQGKYDEIYDLFDERLRSGVTQKETVDQLKDLNEKVGTFKTKQIIKETIKPQSNFRIVNLIIKSEYEKASFYEEFDIAIKDDKAQISHYGHPQNAL